MNKFYSDERLREYINPERIVYKSREVENEEILLSDLPEQPIFANKNFCTLRQGSSIILDFGKEINGCLRIVTSVIEGDTEAKLRIRLGESVSESMAELGEMNAGNNHTASDVN